MPDTVKRLCPICRDAEIALEPYRSGGLSVRESPLSPETYLETEVCICPRCRYVALFVPLSPAEEFEKRKALSPVEKFEHTFRNYTEKQLQKVIDGKDYVPDAKKAAQKLLCRRRGE